MLWSYPGPDVPFKNRLRQEGVSEKLYETNCKRCHGVGGRGMVFGGPNLQKSQLDDDEIKVVIQEGKGRMPSFKKLLTEAEIKSLVEYVKKLKE